MSLESPEFSEAHSGELVKAEFEYFIARSELERNGDLIHGMSHLAQLLTYDPTYPEWLDLLDTYLDRAVENPESLLSEEGRNYYVIEAVRAYIYAKQNKLKEADARRLITESWLFP